MCARGSNRALADGPATSPLDAGERVSYDLMVFDPTAAPREREAFICWYEGQTAWSEDHCYDDHRICSPALQRWYQEMVSFFPPMDGPPASKEHHSGVLAAVVGWYAILQPLLLRKEAK